ncbi:sensor histidine kinase [Actinospica sp.]|jgi:signal transduction histidine kinase|uniref:sensor histidine kinase n=1 Tax=Actinospica sp. TaxID=1872142 RepID=UPI002CFAFCA2|nr:sensor histidine kinase [Actinospica sp.]HWG24201.1 sensor histidine kinase [Actinospica sp.]
MLRMRDVPGKLAAIPPTVVDFAIAAAVTWLSLSTAAGSYPPSGSRPFDALAVLLTSAIGVALVVRRVFPLAVMIACAVLVAVFEARGYWLSLNQLALQLAFFTVASRRGRAWTAAAAAVVYPELMYSNVHEWVGSLFNIYLGTAARVVAIGVIGDGARRLTESHALMADYSGQLQRKQRDREQRLVLFERIRIARELHDVTAHHLSVIAVQAGLARFVLETDPKTADQALRTISEVGSEGLAELRRLISLLRPDEDDNGAGADDRPAPGIGQLPVLVERVGLSGTPSRYTIAGRRRPLPAGIELCVYRVVQESLTNSLKHAPGSSVDVRLEYEPEHIRLTVADTGPNGVAAQRTEHPRSAVAQATEHTGSGMGLTGMRERAALYGGEISAGRKPDGGFEVTLILPIDAPEDEASDPRGEQEPALNH